MFSNSVFLDTSVEVDFKSLISRLKNKQKNINAVVKKFDRYRTNANKYRKN